MPDILSELVHSMPSSSSLRLRAGPLRSFGSQTDGNPVPVGLIKKIHIPAKKRAPNPALR
jgi:hypothetical protein